MSKKEKVRSLFADRETREVFTCNGHPDNARVDPTFAEDSQIKNMLMKFARGEVHPRQPIYADVSSFGDYRETQERLIRLKTDFDKLPSAIRNLAQNDPTRLPEIVQDPRNRDFLTEHGFFKQVQKEQPEATSGASGAGSGVQPQDIEKK